jgi:hypothetical protein
MRRIISQLFLDAIYSWTTPSNNGGCPVEDYEVQLIGNSNFTVNSTTITLSTLTSNTTYQYCILPKNCIGGTWSAIYKATTLPIIFPTVSSSTKVPTIGGQTTICGSHFGNDASTVSVQLGGMKRKKTFVDSWAWKLMLSFLFSQLSTVKILHC